MKQGRIYTVLSNVLFYSEVVVECHSKKKKERGFRGGMLDVFSKK